MKTRTSVLGLVLLAAALPLGGCGLFGGAEEAATQVQDEERPRMAELTREKNAEFLAANKTKPGVQATASGLQYETLTEGTGRSPAATDTVTVHYTGTFINGQEFDSSRARGVPASFPLNRVIKGWTEGLQLMKEGGRTRFVIPYELAYGEAGRGGIPPAQTLVFDVELIKVN